MGKIVAKAKNNKFIAVAKNNKIISESKNVSIPGPPGPPGADSGFTSTAGEQIQAFQPVYVENELAFVAGSDDIAKSLSFAGLSTVGASISNPVDIITAGYITNIAWNWSPNLEIFLGPGGTLTQTPPTPSNSLYRIVVGEATGPDSMIVRISEPILFALNP